MKRISLAILFMLICINTSFARINHCGTIQYFQHQKGLHVDPFLEGFKRTTVADNECTTDDYIDSVYTRKTNHFQIFYTLSGPHKTTEAYIDSLEVFAEYAWNFHTKKMDMQAPKGSKRTLHYLQDVSDGLYPIEVVDIDNLRDSYFYYHGCLGITIPDDFDTGASILLLDNDFLIAPTSAKREIETVNFNGKQCSYIKATEEFENELYGYSYADQWDKALRVTVVHEMYHAVQLRYAEMNLSNLFWFEASASGMEEIAAPDIDDYYAYLPSMFNLMGASLDGMREQYGAGIFFLYLYNYVDKGFDKFIWEDFNKHPDLNFREHLNKLGKKKNISIDSVFHDFSKKLAFAGSKTNFLDSTKWIASDQYFWPDFNYFPHKATEYSFEPSTNEFAYEFHMGGTPTLDNYRGKASIILFKGKNVKVLDLSSLDYFYDIYAKESTNPQVDSIGWIFSRFTSNAFIPQVDDNNKGEKIVLHAYPIPWRSGNLCFTPLPESENFIEIRNRRGDLVTRKNYSDRTLCLDEASVKNLMSPGVYRFRAGSTGKTKDFLIIY